MVHMHARRGTKQARGGTAILLCITDLLVSSSVVIIVVH